MGKQENHQKVLVTGGGGFVGSALVKKLIDSGYVVTSFSRGDYPELRATGVNTIRGNLADQSQVSEAVKGQSVVFHTAALAGFWGRTEDYEDANVRGTSHLVDACLSAGVSKLIYTSTASTVFGGKDIANGSQDLPYPKKFLNDYCRTKALAEQMVIAANTPQMKTISLRPHIIIGPGDNHIIPRLINRARQGRIRMIGSGTNLIDTVYVDNVADAHVLAMRALDENPACRGKAYFITNGEPVNVWQFMNEILLGLDLPPVRKKIPYRTALALSAGMAGIHRLIPSLGEPAFTPFLIRELGRNHWFDPEPARRDLGYTPSVSMEEGLAILISIHKLS